MARLWRKTFEDWKGRQFTLDLSLSEEDLDVFAISGAFDIRAEMYDPVDQSTHVVAAKVELEHRDTASELREEGLYLIVKVEDQTFEFKLSNRWTGALDAESEGSDDEVAVEDALFPESFADHLDELLQAIPVPIDPLLGCVLKSGISATVGQVIRCNNRFLYGKAPHRSTTGRVRQIFGCLRENVAQIARKAMFRTFRCWVTLGYG